MPSQLVIRNRSGYRRPLIFDILVENDLAYGVHDGSWRLKEDEIAEGRVVIYNPEHIGRGIEVLWNDSLTRDVRLTLPLPCTIHDMDVLYRVAARIMAYWETDSFIQDGNVFNLEVIDALKKSFIDYCIRALKETRDSLPGADTQVMICVKNPLYLSVDQLVEFGEDQDMEGFSLLLHQLQERDLYYGSPAIYRKPDGSHFGAYAIVADTDTVLPYKPHPAPLTVDPSTGRPLECDLYVASLTSLSRRKRLATVSYDDFLKAIDVSSMERYDNAHFILKGLSEDEVSRIASLGYKDPLE